ncbi:hypothetical protein HID58_094145 [Brassica napus]|uniref:Uncharacterized protein n=1 Tax=Brassica napus TaxID=3708 RepID=A0ABQ7X8H6_BRANA|nr:hypothetical protein HID58_094145 [Brassica napus]
MELGWFELDKKKSHGWLWRSNWPVTFTQASCANLSPVPFSSSGRASSCSHPPWLLPNSFVYSFPRISEFMFLAILSFSNMVLSLRMVIGVCAWLSLEDNTSLVDLEQHQKQALGVRTNGLRFMDPRQEDLEEKWL